MTKKHCLRLQVFQGTQTPLKENYRVTIQCQLLYGGYVLIIIVFMFYRKVWFENEWSQKINQMLACTYLCPQDIVIFALNLNDPTFFPFCFVPNSVCGYSMRDFVWILLHHCLPSKTTKKSWPLQNASPTSVKETMEENGMFLCSKWRQMDDQGISIWRTISDN